MPKGSISLGIAFFNLILGMRLLAANSTYTGMGNAIGASIAGFGFLIFYLPIATLVGILLALPGAFQKERFAIYAAAIHFLGFCIVAMHFLSRAFP